MLALERFSLTTGGVVCKSSLYCIFLMCIPSYDYKKYTLFAWQWTQQANYFDGRKDDGSQCLQLCRKVQRVERKSIFYDTFNMHEDIICISD